ncbi:DUF6275 family protein [Peptostreptococcus anaerobius]|uniref:DUF6275 family protein n=1 Tax=Peptostreptococcus anaerobius TaxID=1261 RepID=UPI00232D4352|nr:DUF6275 family protein [Peptostreptococcus anaerobius]MDB8821387.1 DUF6275 family protein [Peptostreptococcus anaerobius]MDB8825967.1 DUF6275 family protein [Peptostreptococcus anaerobius]MDB8827872.1 DUF6275 family protein [Peptostreptococcus anaerobius]MDB8829690.1 DUF6275 family protein [Peptostreptococcus anaerobius]MDB8831552.1 DUF6275 family protein [Peptostreptococcus anaerobius]
MISNEQFLEVCAEKVKEYESKRSDIEVPLVKRVFTVWSCKTLQNSKCLMSAAHKGAYYYEFTMNGDSDEIYMDVYKKVENIPLNLDGSKKEKTPKNCIAPSSCCG